MHCFLQVIWMLVFRNEHKLLTSPSAWPHWQCGSDYSRMSNRKLKDCKIGLPASHEGEVVWLGVLVAHPVHNLYRTEWCSITLSRFLSAGFSETAKHRATLLKMGCRTWSLARKGKCRQQIWSLSVVHCRGNPKVPLSRKGSRISFSTILEKLTAQQGYPMPICRWQSVPVTLTKRRCFGHSVIWRSNLARSSMRSLGHEA